MLDKRQRVSDLLDAQVPILEIVDIVKCSKQVVYRIRKKKKAGESLARKPGSGGKNKIIDQDFLLHLAVEIEADPTRSMRKMSKDLSVSEFTIRKAVGQLGLHSYVRRRRQLLSKSTNNIRVERGKKIINWLKKKPSSVVLVFSDKKNWMVDQSRNARNDRYLAFSRDEVPAINQTKHPASAMMLGVVASDGKRMPPFWFTHGLRVGAKEYLEVLETVVEPWLDQQNPEGNYCWQQDGAPGHKARMVQQWCKENLADFWPANFWPPSSPDAAPLDYGI